MWLVLGLLSLCAPMQAVDPGLQLSIRESWLNSLWPTLLSEVRSLILNRNFGNFSIAYPLDLGTIYLNLTDLTVTDVSLDVTNSSVYLSSPNYFNITMLGVNVTVNSGYSAKYTISKYEGIGQVAISNVAISTNFTLFQVNNKPQITINDLIIDPGTLTLESNLSSIISKIVVDAAESELNSLSKTALSRISGYITTANRLLSLINMQFKLGDEFMVDAGLVEGFKVQDGVVAMGVNGTFYLKSTQGGGISPTELVSLPVDFEFNEGIGVMVSDYSVSSAIQSYVAGMDLFVEKLPHNLSIALTTNTVAVLFPQLKTTYGANVPIALHISSGEPLPQYFTSNGLINLLANLKVEFLVLQTGQWVSGLTISFNTTLSLAASIRNNQAVGELQSLNLTDFEVIQSNVGEVNFYLLNVLVQDALETYRPAINSMLSYDIEVPSWMSIEVGDNDFAVSSGYCQLAVDLVFPSNSS